MSVLKPVNLRLSLKSNFACRSPDCLYIVRQRLEDKLEIAAARANPHWRKAICLSSLQLQGKPERLFEVTYEEQALHNELRYVGTGCTGIATLKLIASIN